MARVGGISPAGSFPWSKWMTGKFVVIGYPESLPKFQEPNKLDAEQLQRVADLCESGTISAVIRSGTISTVIRNDLDEAAGSWVEAVGVPHRRTPIAAYASSLVALQQQLPVQDDFDLNYEDIATVNAPRSVTTSMATVSTTTSGAINIDTFNTAIISQEITSPVRRSTRAQRINGTLEASSSNRGFAYTHI